MLTNLICNPNSVECCYFIYFGVKGKNTVFIIVSHSSNNFADERQALHHQNII